MADYFEPPPADPSGGQTAGNPYGFTMGRQQPAGPAAPPPPASTAGMSIGDWGSRGFNLRRPGMDPRLIHGQTNPQTGLPYQSYEEWAQVNMPAAYASSQMGTGAISQPNQPWSPAQPQQPQFAQQQQRAPFRPPPMPEGR